MDSRLHRGYRLEVLSQVPRPADGAIGAVTRSNRSATGCVSVGRPTTLPGRNLVGGRLLVIASYLQTVKAVMSQFNWRARMGGWLRTGRGGVVGHQVRRSHGSIAAYTPMMHEHLMAHFRCHPGVRFMRFDRSARISGMICVVSGHR